MVSYFFLHCVTYFNLGLFYNRLLVNIRWDTYSAAQIIIKKAGTMDIRPVWKTIKDISAASGYILRHGTRAVVHVCHKFNYITFLWAPIAIRCELKFSPRPAISLRGFGHTIPSTHPYSRDHLYSTLLSPIWTLSPKQQEHQKKEL